MCRSITIVFIAQNLKELVTIGHRFVPYAATSEGLLLLFQLDAKFHT